MTIKLNSKKVSIISFILWILSIGIFIGMSIFIGKATKVNNGNYTLNQTIAVFIPIVTGTISFLVLVSSFLLKIIRNFRNINFKKLLKTIFIAAFTIYGLIVIFMTGKLANILIEMKNEKYASTKTLGAADMVALINYERTSRGISAVTENKQLDASAKAKCNDMLAKKYFDHNDPTGRTPWHFFFESGYIYRFAGENLVSGYYGDQESMRRLMNSPEHKENILDPKFTEVGIGKCGENTTQHFASR